ncbi:HupE/UreJ family protein [Phenylobacterium sp. LjRoot225]|uniref:HupE/UreJ family protein n=1 Tax=Phenylobacterium sp. LjRoot225 TaxID=3342285 RepID=UPI003ECE1AA4
MRRRLLALLAVLSLGLLAAQAAAAHEVRPAYLEIRQEAPDRFLVTWKQPTAGDVAVRLAPRLSNGWLETAPAESFASPGFLIRAWRVRDEGPDPLAGRTLAIEGLDQTITDALVRVELADGRSLETILRPDSPQITLAFQGGPGLAVPAYFRLGMEHILTGIDHLMFVLGLLLLVGVRWRMLQAITAFTVAHSLTLGASALGWVTAPSAVIEALVALSIVFVACELANRLRGQAGLTARFPWLIAFTFGLLHGFAFAGALVEVGLPKDAIPLSLLLFNLGVEAGQLIFVGAAILAILALRPVRARLPAIADRLALRLPPYAIGSFAAFWVLERTAAAFA